MLPSERLEFTVHDDAASGFRVLELRGPLVVKTTAQLEAALRLDNDFGIILDFAGVRYMDSSGLGALLGGLALYQRKHQRFAIANVNSRIQTTMELTHSDEVLNLYSSVELAKAARRERAWSAAQ